MVVGAIKRSVVVVAALAALVSAGPAAPSSLPPAGDQATEYQMDATHDGSIADAGLTAPLTQAWSITLPGATSPSLIVNGTVFVTSKNTLYAIDQATGSTIWSRGLGASAGLAYDRGQVFALTNHGVLSAFDAATGSSPWTLQLPEEWVFNSPPTATNGIVYADGAGAGGDVYAVRESDGHLLWTVGVNGGGGSSPAVTSDGLYVSYDCQQAYAFNPLTGSLLWHRSTRCTGGGGVTTPVANGYLFARDNYLGNVILSTADGSPHGSFLAGAHDHWSPINAVGNGVAFEISGTWPGTTLIAVAGTGLGGTKWTFNGDGYISTPPIVAGGLVFIGSGNNKLYGLDATTGAAVWSTTLGAQPTDLAAANGTLVVSAGSTLAAYRSAGTIADPPSNTSAPSVQGSAALNELEAADVGIWSGLPSTYAYQWELCDAAGANCADIVGATAPTYVPSPDGYGATVRVRVTATNGVGSSAPVESAASALLGLTAAAPAFSSAPVVSGPATVGQQLSTTTGVWTNSARTYAYQWQRCDDTTGSNCADIPGATSPQYTPVTDDIGYHLRVEVLASNGVGPAPSGDAPSETTRIVIEVGTPSILTGPADEATSYQLDPAHDGYIADAGLAAPLTQAWSVPLVAPANPLIVDGTVYVTSDNTVYALNQATGSTTWSRLVYPSGLGYDRGRIFAGSFILDAATGSTTSSGGPTGLPTAANGVIYTAIGKSVNAMRESDGAILWAQPINDGDESWPAVTADGVYVSYPCQRAWAFDPLFGTVRWHHTTPCSGGGATTAPVAAGGHVFVSDPLLGNAILSSSAGSTEGSFDQGASPAVANGVAFMLSSSTLNAVAGNGLGGVDWTFGGDGKLVTAPIVAGGLVFVGSSGGNLYALDATTGATAWSTNVGATPTSLAASNGTLVVAAGNHLIAYRTDGAIDAAPSNESLPRVEGPADLSGLESVDVGVWSGLPSGYAYQWELCDSAGANCVDIAGATGATYMPPAEDAGVGDTLRVRVVASNGIGSSAPVESVPSATSPLLLDVQQQKILHKPGQAATSADGGSDLTTTDGIWTDDPTSYAYRWQRCDDNGLHCVNIAGATGSEYAPGPADQGHEIRSEVRASNAVGPAAVYEPSDPSSPMIGPEISTAPVVTGQVAVGSQLATTTGAWTNGATSYAYKWQRCDENGANCTDIAGATSAQYTVVSADTGYNLRSAVLASNQVGPSSRYAPAAVTSPVGGLARPAMSSAPSLDPWGGNLGEPLTTTHGTWTESPTAYLVKWQRCDKTGSNCADIPNATAVVYTLAPGDVGNRVRSEVLASNAAGPAAAWAPSPASGVVGIPGKPDLLGSPVVSGTPAVGQQLSTTGGNWTNSPTSYKYEWLRCNGTGDNCGVIAGATSAQYTLVDPDSGYEIRSAVLAINGGGAAQSGYAQSAPTSVVTGGTGGAVKPAVTLLPKVSGTAKVGSSLSVSTGTWTHSPAFYAYQWLRCTSTGTSCKKIAGATSPSYLLASADAGHKLKAKVTASNAAGSATATSSNASAKVKK